MDHETNWVCYYSWEKVRLQCINSNWIQEFPSRDSFSPSPHHPITSSRHLPIFLSCKTAMTNMTKNLQNWLKREDGDMVWQTVVLVSVLLPLASLCIDVPRYFTLRSRLQLALDGATQAAVQCVDMRHFQNVGETRLLPECVQSESNLVFAQATQDLQSKGYQPALTSIAVDEQLDQVSGKANGTTTLFFGLSPQFAVTVASVSKVRMEKR